MLSLFTLKKILFISFIGSGITGPIIATSPVVREFSFSSEDISPLKQGIKSLENINLYDDQSVSSFLQSALINREGQEGLIESFAQELSRQWYFSKPKNWIQEQINHWNKEHEYQFKSAWERMKPKDPQRDFWDNYWGSKESMNSFGLRFKSHELVKNFLTNLDKTDFRMNSQESGSSWWTSNSSVNSNDISKYFLNSNYFLRATDLKDKTKFNKIGFYPSKLTSFDNAWEEIIWNKYDFINWSYKKWFNSNLPLYFWKISWNYKKDAKEFEIKQKYNSHYLGIHFPKTPNYAFPYFSTETNEKFKSFIGEISKNNGGGNGGSGADLNLEKKHIPKEYSDQGVNGGIFEVLKAYQTESPELASALSYLVGKSLKNSNGGGSSYLNEIKLENGKKDQLPDPISIFLESSGWPNNKGADRTINIDSSIFSSGERYFNSSYDVRETKSGWLFYRDEKGVHAIKLDGEEGNASNNNGGTNKKEEDLFNWFNFRNLQSTWAKANALDQKSLISSHNDWFNVFSQYISENFNSLFTQYFLEKDNSVSFFKSLGAKKSYFSNYVPLLNSLIKLQKNQTFYSSILDLRRKIIERYSKRDWELSSSLIDNTAKVSKKDGLSSVFPYKVSLEDSTSSGGEKNNSRFPDQEEIYKKFLSEEKKDIEKAAKVENGKSSEFIQLLNTYYTQLKTFFEEKKVSLTARQNGFSFQNSQRIFIQDPVFDFLMDKLFSQKELLDYIVKERKLMESSFFNQNKLLKKSGESRSILDTFLKFQEVGPGQAEQTGITQVEAAQASTSSTTCEYTEEGTAQQSKLNSLSHLIMESYLFRTYLKNFNDNYFTFLADFANLSKTTTGATTTNGENGGTQKITENQLFLIWQQSSLTNIKEKTKLLDFLLTLDYLTKDKFANFKSYLRGKLSDNYKYHYLFFELKQPQEKGNKDQVYKVSPFLSLEKGNKKYFKNKQELWTFIREEWKPGDKLTSSTNQGGAGGNGSSSFPNTPLMLQSLKLNNSQTPSGKENLFNFVSLDELAKHIDSVEGVRNFDNLVSFLSRFNEKIKPSVYHSDKIFYTLERQKQGGSSITEKQLNLSDKKNALKCQVKNKNAEIETNFTNKCDQNGQGGGTGTSGGTNGNGQGLDSKLFEREKAEVKSGYFIQVSKDDFESDTKMCQLFQLLTSTLLSEFIIQQVDDKLNSEEANKSFFNNTPKIKAHDLKFKSHLDSRFSS